MVKMQQKTQTANTTRHSTNAVDDEDRQGVDALGFGFSGGSNDRHTANLVQVGKATIPLHSFANQWFCISH